MNSCQQEIILWGATGHAAVLRECLNYTDRKLVAIFDNNFNCLPCCSDIPLFYGVEGFKQWLDKQKPYDFSIAIGGTRGKDRINISNFLIGYGLRPFTICHPTAFVAKNAELAVGVQVLANASVCVGVKIGKQSIINTAAIVDHECQLGEGVHICPGAKLAGCVVVDDMATIGTGAVILPRIRIGKGAIVGAAAVVTKDVPDYSTVIGNPAKKLTVSNK